MSEQVPLTPGADTTSFTDPLLQMVASAKLRSWLNVILHVALSNSQGSTETQVARFFQMCTGNPLLANALARVYRIVTTHFRFAPIRAFVLNLFKTVFLSRWRMTLKVDAKTSEFNNIIAYVRKERPTQYEVVVESSDSTKALQDGIHYPRGVFYFLRQRAVISVSTGLQNGNNQQGKLVLTASGFHPQEALQDFVKLCKDSAGPRSKISLNGDTVYRPDEKKMKALKDVKRFWSQKHEAETRTINHPHRRRYLFHGKPGPGKTEPSVLVKGNKSRF
ncbi:hypothetical protein EG327_004885 [Venturia inaequalis]|uniref:Uncharacterized protein n=1 Tax=Venturia inaequalis TaxID=5025 RepID=A0A8H3VD99_VENIN|nr:hypothetical protein EG327_004885 [Venturia inaequalis]